MKTYDKKPTTTDTTKDTHKGIVDPKRTDKQSPAKEQGGHGQFHRDERTDK
jgi:hypothetical protein